MLSISARIRNRVILMVLAAALLPAGGLYARRLSQASQAVITLDGQRDAGYALLAQDPAGDLANPGPGGWAGTAWTDLTQLYTADDGTYLYVYVDLPAYASGTSSGEVGLVFDTGTGGSGSEPWGNAITFAYTSTYHNVGQSPVPTTTILLPNVVIRGNIPGIANNPPDDNNGWTELRTWNGSAWTGSGANWGGISMGSKVGTHVAYGDGSGVEFRIPYADLGIAPGSRLHLQFFATQKGAGKGAFDTLPADDQSGNWDDPTVHKHLATYDGTSAQPCAGSLPGDGLIRADAIYHSNLELAYRDPLGAAAMNISPTLRLQTCAGDVQGVQVLVWQTGQPLGSPTIYSAAVGQSGAYDMWEFQVPPPGVLTDQWYQFKVIDGGSSGYYRPPSGNFGPGAWYASGPDNPSWSLARSGEVNPTPTSAAPTPTPGPTPTPAPQCGGEALGDSAINPNGVYHLDTDPAYRQPTGDITWGQTATLILRTCQQDVQQVQALVWKTGAGANPSYVYAASPVQTDTLSHVVYWAVEVPSADVLIDQWYQFKLNDGIKVGYYHPASGNSGVGVWSDRRIDPSWKLGVRQPPPADYPLPAWMQDAVIYQIFPDRFRNGNAGNDPPPYTDNVRIYDSNTCSGYPHGRGSGPQCVVDKRDSWTDPLLIPSYGLDFYGGDLQGIIEKINAGYFNDLGVNTLYLNPVFDASSNHGYDTNNYYDIRDYFGNDGSNDNAVFDALIAAADAKGLRVILDAVFNHAGMDSNYIDHDRSGNGACASSTSPYRPWFTAGSQTGDLGCDGGWGWKGWYGYETIPEFVDDNADVRDFFFRGGSLQSPLSGTQRVSVSEFWISRGIAGWRYDVAQDISHAWFQEMRPYIKGSAPVSGTRYGHPDVLMLGEVTGGCDWGLYQNYLNENELDSAMNYCFRDWAVGFANGGAPSNFDGAFNAFRARFPSSAWHAMMNLVSSHDSPRALRLLNDDTQRLKLLALLQMSLPGAPSVYYGDEVGLTGGGDPDNRRTYPWADQGGSPDLGVYQHFKTVIGIRNAYSALRGGDMQTLLVDDTNHVYSYLRWDDAQKVVVVLKNTPGSAAVSLPVAAHFADGLVLTDTLNGGVPYTVTGGQINLTLAGQSGVILIGPQLTVQRTISVPGEYRFGDACARLNFATPADVGGLEVVTVSLAYEYPTVQGEPRPLKRKYTIAANVTTGFTASLTLCYADDELGGIPEGDLRLYRYDVMGGNWISYTSSVEPVGNLVTAADVHAFSTWAVGALGSQPTDVVLRDMRRVDRIRWLERMMVTIVAMVAGVGLAIWWMMRRCSSV